MIQGIQRRLFFNMPLKKSRNGTTFIDNLALPIHRWFRFSAGFSAIWVKEIISSEIGKRKGDVVLLDPFVGSGTSLLCADECRIKSYGIESQPFIAKIARTKTQWKCDINKFIKISHSVVRIANDHQVIQNNYPQLIYKCFDENTLLQLEGLKIAWNLLDDQTIESSLVWLCITSILRLASIAGTAQWQYVLPKKKKKSPLQPFTAFRNQLEVMVEDLSYYQINFKDPLSIFIEDNSMFTKVIPDKSINLVITSPPYANNYDYGDATRLEMSFWGEIKGWHDLQEKARKNLIRSCSHQAALVGQSLEKILSDPDLYPLVPEIKEKTEELEIEKENHGGKKDYHLMIAGYFSDMAKVWKNLRRMCKEGSVLCFVIGDSAPYGIYIPVDEWLGKLAIASGFKSFEFEKVRDRNIKWKNRKHKVPLKEGNLWVEG